MPFQTLDTRKGISPTRREVVANDPGSVGCEEGFLGTKGEAPPRPITSRDSSRGEVAFGWLWEGREDRAG